MTTLTAAQAAVLRALPPEYQTHGLTARQVAREVWPDDPGWQKRTSGRGASRHNGAHGATLPLRAGRVLRRLEDAGLATQSESDTRWWLTQRGVAALAEAGR